MFSGLKSILQAKKVQAASFYLEPELSEFVWTVCWGCPDDHTRIGFRARQKSGIATSLLSRWKCAEWWDVTVNFLNLKRLS